MKNGRFRRSADETRQGGICAGEWKRAYLGETIQDVAERPGDHGQGIIGEICQGINGLLHNFICFHGIQRQSRIARELKDRRQIRRRKERKDGPCCAACWPEQRRLSDSDLH